MGWVELLLAGLTGAGGVFIAYLVRNQGQTTAAAEKAAKDARRARDEHAAAIAENKARDALRASYEHDKAALAAKEKDRGNALSHDPTQIDQALVDAASDNPFADPEHHH